MSKTSADLIAEKCDALKEFLLAKNASYGDAVLDPVRIFSQASSVEQIGVRLDDKLSRLKRGGEFDGDDTLLDLTGYLVLLLIAREVGVPVVKPRGNFRDNEGDLWVHVADAEWRCIPYPHLTRGLDQIESVYGPLTWE